MRQVGMVDVSSAREDHLLGLFWTWQNAWLRVVAREPFEREREARRGNDACGRFCSPALLLAMLALGAHYDSDSEENAKGEEAGEAFASRAKIMLLHEGEAPSPTTVQALALLSVREMALDREGPSGMYCGMAVRMALSLGLHLDCGRCVAEGLLSAEQAEVRCVAWWGCYLLDKQLNIGLGRPSGVLDCLVTVKWPDEACEEERGAWGGEREDDMVARGVSCSIYACRMLLEVVEILDNIYSPNKPDKPGMATDAYLRLTSFYNALPAPLRVPRAATTRALPHVYQLQY
ncbi:uncharacterized protein K452DRAFT_159067 [Aplosporella prunicola CBS 121167]|uniref:Xylanolytic transcriptional activator regulatory domain-containing protein n=1 Tax=Aplosporella prunicola CBS 121167 TaxID=1176127 RepID=A0A6A6BKY8_9PEZI|nr:uncharacterized protein K452DRAFT_159067 [Aplosporella prunicola CBS 121167]KAF2143527.1 hypothetical protein K452DRAFT_159067 [Aplosporella prunicola CBS 121167]